MIQMLNSAGAEWGDLFLLTVIQNTLFLGLVFVALHLLRNAPARVRYLVALAGFVKLVLPPFLRIPSISPIPETVAGYGGLIPFMTGSAGVSDAARSAAEGESLTPAGALLGIWAIVVLAGLVYMVAGSVRLALRLRGSRMVPDRELPAITGAEGIEILRSDRIAMPITVAFMPGRIYVPASWDEWTPNCRRMVVLHEMAHLKRHDGLALMMQIIARAIYFFHPLVAVLDRRLSEYREMACDDATVGRDRDSGVEYSRYLVEIAESVVRCPAVCGSASALIRRKNELLARVRYQLEEGRMRSISKTRVMMLAVAIVLLTVSLSWYSGDASTGSDYPALPVPPDPPRTPEEASESGKRTVSVSLESEGAEVDGKQVDISRLVEALKTVGGEDPENVMVRFVCADDVSMGQLRLFHEALGEAGIDKIRYGRGEGEGLALQLPPQDAIDRLEEMPGSMTIDVILYENGDAAVGLKKVKDNELAGNLEDQLAENPLAIVVIHNDQNTSYGDFVRVLGLVKNCGAERVVVKFSESE